MLWYRRVRVQRHVVQKRRGVEQEKLLLLWSNLRNCSHVKKKKKKKGKMQHWGDVCAVSIQLPSTKPFWEHFFLPLPHSALLFLPRAKFAQCWEQVQRRRQRSWQHLEFLAWITSSPFCAYTYHNITWAHVPCMEPPMGRSAGAAQWRGS